MTWFISVGAMSESLWIVHRGPQGGINTEAGPE
jgi:hypothetical protein